MAKRYAPSLEALCWLKFVAFGIERPKGAGIGPTSSLAPRDFTAKDLKAYTPSAKDAVEIPSQIKWLKKNRLIAGDRKYRLTPKGQKMVGKACRLWQRR